MFPLRLCFSVVQKSARKISVKTTAVGCPSYTHSSTVGKTCYCKSDFCNSGSVLTAVTSAEVLVSSLYQCLLSCRTAPIPLLRHIKMILKFEKWIFHLVKSVNFLISLTSFLPWKDAIEYILNQFFFYLQPNPLVLKHSLSYTTYGLHHRVVM